MASSKKKKHPRRLKLKLGPKRAKSFDMLMVHCGSQNETELFNGALSLLEWAAGEMRAGRRVVSLDRQNAIAAEAVI